MNTIKWIGRWHVWWFIILRQAFDGLSSEREINARAIPFVLGPVTLVTSIAFLTAGLVSTVWSPRLMLIIGALFFLLYLLVGLGFFFSERTMSDERIPWHLNGSW